MRTLILTLALFTSSLIAGQVTAIEKQIILKHHHNCDFATPLNNTDLFTAGMDEFLPASAVVIGKQGFFDTLDWDQATINTFRNSVATYFADRFGIDFNGPGSTYDETSGFTFLVTPEINAILIPLEFKGNYRVYASNDNKIKDKPIANPSCISAVEFVCIINSVTPGTNYGGTYGAAVTIPINVSDTLDFAVYHINGKGTKDYDIFGRSFFPNRVDPTPTYPNRVNETLQLFSEDFGSGAGFLNVAVPNFPDANGLWPTFVRFTASFPVFTLPDLNGFNVSPI